MSTGMEETSRDWASLYFFRESISFNRVRLNMEILNIQDSIWKF